MTRPIEAFDLDRDLEEWSEDELQELFDALAETDTRLGRFLAEHRGDHS